MPLAPYGQNFHGVANGNWKLLLTLTERVNHVIYFRGLGDGGYLEDGDQVVYVQSGLGCTDAARANYPMDQGENQDYGGIVNRDAAGALTTTVNMALNTDFQYKACYYKPVTLAPIQGILLQNDRRRRLSVSYGQWTEIDAFISVGQGTATTPAATAAATTSSPARS